ncbi:hypothetical protein AUEXF2481DRAFT_7370 [Aureobasidium subglaciale EXF-2481]|uniref:Uncharacterized protein n=1 Tax=Aureobasidium subglaciale (strain EXF-2481) TaxID=1043005 RepID=A0A074Z0M9_AURSE|nr:uncharacterized protein AUEXF2481DRAFT_7370 [Aureobasidium subglaciale EXF-2481]KAI5210763.1 hypothetical protein E4T38_01868 [Aureobasidium subglaciale]KAI5229247.1 hypothetical protein E4T40_01611 [Aureobasidium subglaciale]KAI5232970.1 hypothetical protein E4T41_01866 [Aureobasidium subglaciale]KAI5266368.1 hypothetical protein E4T46_01608 [Aureobasidium subglaciale]KEQ92621.1 hypothetical protein AUEXF2481DRAFT_7370 [Aureobasidium subglaciale EXF-2481]
MAWTLNKTTVANRCLVAGTIGLHLEGNLHPTWVPTGGETHDLSGKVTSITFGASTYSIAGLTASDSSSVAMITKEDRANKLAIDVADAKGHLTSFETAPGKPLSTIIPDDGAVGHPDVDLEVEALATRYLNRAITIADRKLHPLQSRLLMASDKGDDKFDNLVAMLSNTSSDPKTEAANGVPPSNSRIAADPVVPAEVPTEAKANIPDNMLKLSQAQGAVSLYTNIWSIAMRTKRGHPDAYKVSIPEEASQLNADLADSVSQCLQGPLAGYLSKIDGNNGGIHKEMFTTDIHLEFLNTFFDSFGFQAGDIKELDGVLTNVVQALSSLKVSSSSTSSDVNHVMTTRGFREVIVPDSSGSPEIVAYEPIIRSTYLHVAQSSWEVSIGKSSVEKVKFDMDYADDTYVLNVPIFDKHTAKLDAVMQSLICKNTADFGKDITHATANGQQKSNTSSESAK